LICQINQSVFALFLVHKRFRNYTSDLNLSKVNNWLVNELSGFDETHSSTV